MTSFRFSCMATAVVCLGLLTAAPTFGEAKLDGRNRAKPSAKAGDKVKARTKSSLSASVREAAAKIDALVDANRKEKGGSVGRRTTDEEFLRRVYLDAIGRIPSYDETVAFLKSKDPSRRAKLIDKLVNGPGYASHMYNFWADQLRVTNRIRGDYGGNYQKWIKEQMEWNAPYDQFVRALLTAEGKSHENGAVGYYLRDNGMVLEITSQTSQIFLGTQIGCAQCHDHPFDTWEQKQFYEFAAFTEEVNTRDRQTGAKYRDLRRILYKKGDEVSPQVQGLVRRLVREASYKVEDFDRKELRLPSDYKYDNGKPNEMVHSKTIYGESLTPLRGQTQRERFAQWMTSKSNPMFAKVIANRMWAKLIGIGIVEPVDNFSDLNPPTNPKLLTYLEQLMKDLNFDLREFQRVVLNTKTYQLATNREDFAPEAFVNQAGVLRRMTAEQVWDSVMTLTAEDIDARKAPNIAAMQMGMGMDMDGGSGNVMNAINKMSAQEILDYAERVVKERRATSRQAAQKRREMFMRARFTRASEQQQPARPGTFLAQFGASSRETVGDAHTDPSVPQVLTMLNSPNFNMLAYSTQSVLGKNVLAAKTPRERVERAYLSILNRYPTPAERVACIKEIDRDPRKGTANVIWALLNTREFLFIR